MNPTNFEVEEEGEEDVRSHKGGKGNKMQKRFAQIAESGSARTRSHSPGQTHQRKITTYIKPHKNKTNQINRTLHVKAKC